MAQTPLNSDSTQENSSKATLTFQADGHDRIELPSHDLISDAKMTRDGDDLVLQSPDGTVAVIEGYFSADPAPLIQSADGAVLTPNLVESFAKSPMEFAANGSANDESPVGAVEEVKGAATVTHADGTVETIVAGTPIYQGDIVETEVSGAVNIVFMDETSMAISQNARMAIDEYTFDPSTESGTTNLSVLRGLFVFTSGLIGRDDPDDVKIDTPVGSIGIRGTIIAGEINPGGESNISVLEGAIVVSNGSMEATLSKQFETIRLGSFNEPMHEMGVVPASDINTKFNSIGNVLPSLFSVIHDAVQEQSSQPHNDAPPAAPSTQPDTKADSADQSQNTTEQPQAPALQDIVTLKDTSGLPSVQTAAGQNSTPFDSTQTGTGGTVTGTAGTAGNNATPPSGSSTAAPDAAATTNQGDAPLFPISNTGDTAPVSPAAIALTYAAVAILADTADANHVVGTVTSNRADATFTLTDNPDNYFMLVDTGNGTAEIVLTSDGAEKLGSSLDVQQLGSFAVTVTGSDSQQASQSVTPVVTDANTTPFNLENAPNVAIITDNLSNHVGYSITAVGDFNHDGLDDFLASNNASVAGQNHVLGFSGTQSPLVDGTITGLGPDTYNNPGSTAGNLETLVTGIGDFNGDGTLDWAIGQSGGMVGAVQSGQISVVNGVNGSTGLSLTTYAGIAIGDGIGSSISGIGDYNNDGYADVLVGAPGAANGQGQAFLIGGSAIAFTESLNAQRVTFSSTGISAYGAAVAGIGDVNGDGYSDFAIGAPNGSGGNGYVEIQFGHKTGTTAPAAVTITGSANEGLGTEITGLGDINGDGYSDFMTAGSGSSGAIILGGSLSQSTYNLNEPGSAYEVTGGGSVGDFNGDGFDDFAISMADSTHTKLYVVYGKDGTVAPDLSLDYLKDPNNAFEMTYNGANNSSGPLEISGVGDLNGDGRDDFAIGLPDANGASAGNGGFAVVYGRDTDGNTVKANATGNDQGLVGSTAGETLNDGGYSNVSFHAGSGDDIIKISNADFRNIDAGGGTAAANSADTLFFAGGVGQSLDFSNINYEQISGIEKIQFGANDQTITLTMENIFNLLKSSDGYSDGTHDYSGFLKITAEGMNGAHLVLNGDSTAASGASANVIDTALESYSGAGSVTTTDTTGGAGTYDTFKIGGYTLLIENTVTVDVQ